MKEKKYNRRSFIGTASCASLGMATFFSTFFDLHKVNAAVANKTKSHQPPGDYRALVCILLAGGNDSYNMLIPKGASEYAEYSVTRSNLAIPNNQILDINPATYNAQQLGLHPSMPEVQQLFGQGKLAFLANVGTMIEPTTKQMIYSDQAKLPLGLFSHADQIQQWQTSLPNSRSAIGWGGRLADILAAANSNQNLSMNVSLAGNNVFQAGNQTIAYSIEPSGTGSIGINGFDNDEDPFQMIKSNATKSLLEQTYQDIFKKTYARTINQSQASHEQFSSAIGGVDLNTRFSNNYVSQSMQMIAKTIASRQSLGMQKQTFFLTFGGWDHHDEVLNAQKNMLPVVSKALDEFYKATVELGVADQVTTFTISDFARTLTSNGNGTDHAWGGNVMVMGDAVKGGEIYGQYPSLALRNNLDLGNGVLVPTTSTDEYFAELALWFGLSKSDLPLVLPNLANFYNINGSANPIGFMNN
ncbi:MAG: DUF1501 domain-containing protein [Bacteroidota bacterium]